MKYLKVLLLNNLNINIFIIVISYFFTNIILKFQAKALGRVLFDQVCKQLHLLEADYFGLEYQEPNFTKVRYILDINFQCSISKI